MFMRASGASEVENFEIVYIVKVLYFFQYFVGTNDMLMVYDAIYKRQYTNKALTLHAL